MFDGNDDARRDRRVAGATGSVGRHRCSAEDKAAVIRETLVPGTRISDVARRWQMDLQQVYRWRHSEGVTPRGSTQRRVAAMHFGARSERLPEEQPQLGLEALGQAIAKDEAQAEKQEPELCKKMQPSGARAVARCRRICRGSK